MQLFNFQRGHPNKQMQSRKIKLGLYDSDEKATDKRNVDLKTKLRGDGFQ